jgi:anaerobic magnesium-protoporphyrin IX monomethyl ester cyclase
MKIDCLIIGYNDFSFDSYVKIVKRMGKNHGAYRDLDLAFVQYKGKPYRLPDLLNHFRQNQHKPLHNADFLWPVITYLGSYLNRRNFSFDYINLFHFEKEALKEKLEKNDILTIAITTTLYVWAHPVIEIVSFIKKYNTKVKIVVGGPFIYNLTLANRQSAIQSTFKCIGADFYVISPEGEAALVNIIGALKNNLPPDKINNIAYKTGKDYVITPALEENNSLVEEMVEYNLFPKKDFGEFVLLRTAKSCPFACSYCGFHQRVGKYSYMDVERVEKELDMIKNIGTVHRLTFIDDTFNVPKTRFKNILRMMIKNKYGFKWNTHYRCDRGDEETIELMKEAGCEGVFLGVESGNDHVLKVMNKTSRRKDYIKAIPLLKKAGIWAHANFIIGFPPETGETVRDTIDLIETAKPDTYRAQLWYADPITSIWQRKEEFGIKGSSFSWSHHTMDADTASGIIEQMFLSIKNSIWLPQLGFELWSVFYLQSKGMSKQQVKTLINGFNTIVKQKLINKNNSNHDHDVLKYFKKPGFLKNIKSNG